MVQVTKGVWASGPVLNNVLTIDYAYDYMGRLLLRDDGTNVTTFEWDGWIPIGEVTGSTATRYYAPEGVLLSFTRGSETYQVHRDALGSVRMVTDSSGAVLARFEYGAWGELLSGSFDSVPGGMPYQFVGALGVRFDADTGLHYMRHRWYDSQLGRFIRRDPIGLSGGANLYSYVNNDPTRYVDPTGLQPTLIIYYDGTCCSPSNLRRLQESIARDLPGILVRVVCGTTPWVGWDRDTLRIQITERDETVYGGLPGARGPVLGQGSGAKQGPYNVDINLGSIADQIRLNRAAKQARGNYEALGVPPDAATRIATDNLIVGVAKHETGHAITSLPNHASDGSVMDYRAYDSPGVYHGNVPAYPEAYTRTMQRMFEAHR